MFEYLMSFALVFLAWQYVWFKKTEKHNKHLYRLCQVRREAMKLLLDERENLSKEEAYALRDNIELLNTLINQYGKHKARLFNFRLFLARVKEAKQFERKQTSHAVVDERVLQVRHNTLAVIFGAFWDFTPFLRHELIARIAITVVSAAVSVGIKSLSKLLKDIQQVVEVLAYVKPPERRYYAM